MGLFCAVLLSAFGQMEAWKLRVSCLPEVPVPYQQANASFYLSLKVEKSAGHWVIRVVEDKTSKQLNLVNAFKILDQACIENFSEMGLMEALYLVMRWRHGAGWVDGILVKNGSKVKVEIIKGGL